MIQKYIESDYELCYLDYGRLGLIRKIVKNFSPFFFNFQMITSFIFLFCNIVNIDVFSVHRFFLVIWLFTGCFGSLMQLKINLRLGVYYYHFMISYNMKKRWFFNTLSFLLDDYLTQQFWNESKFLENYYILGFKNLEPFTNYKLARGVYFHRVQQKFFLKLMCENLLSGIFKLFLTTLKLYVI